MGYNSLDEPVWLSLTLLVLTMEGLILWWLVHTEKRSITPAPSTLFLHPQQDSKGRRNVDEGSVPWSLT